MDNNKIFRAIKKDNKLRSSISSNYKLILDEIIPNLAFEHEGNRFYIEYQPSDGIVLADDYAKVYSLLSIINHINKNGAIKSYFELSSFSI